MKNLLILLMFMAQGSLAMNRESGGRQSAAAVYVDFKSLGNGIDESTLKFMEELITQAVSEDLVKEIVRTYRPYEGERTICVHFHGGHFDGAGPRYYFVKALASSILNDSQPRTDVYVGISCQDITKATKQDLKRISEI